MAKTKSTALATKKNEALAAPMEDWEIELAKKVKAQKAQESSGGLPRISHEGGELSIDGNSVKDNKLTGVIVGYVFSKSYYPKPYKQGEVQTPTCYAFARAEDGEKSMVPHEAAPDKQSEQCAGCPHNVFGTAFQGNGKRCKDERQLAIMVGVEDEEALAEAEVRTMNVPPGSLKNFSNFLKKLDQITNYGVYGVQTEFSTEKLGGGHAVTFRPADSIDKAMVRSIVQNTTKVEDSLIRPWPVLGDAAGSAPSKPMKKLDGKKGRR